jgi:hypothetical protein
MTTQTKKLLSAFGVTALVGLLGTLGQYVAKLPPELQTGALAIIAGAVHALNAWGTKQGIDAQVSSRVAKAISAEPVEPGPVEP